MQRCAKCGRWRLVDNSTDMALVFFFIIGPLFGSLYLLSEPKWFGGFSLMIALIGIGVTYLLLSTDTSVCDGCAMKAARQLEEEKAAMGVFDVPLANKALAGALILRPGEEAKDVWRVHLYARDDSKAAYNERAAARAKGGDFSMADALADRQFHADGMLVATNMRILFAAGTPQINAYQTTQSFDMDQIIGIAAKGTFLEMITNRRGSNIVYVISDLFRVQRSSLEKMMIVPPTELAAKLNDHVRSGLEFIEGQKRRANVQYILDFSFLKAEMEKGGLVVQSVKCPSCSAAIAFPQTGSTTKCEYCGATVFAQDVFDRIKGLMKQT